MSASDGSSVACNLLRPWQPVRPRADLLRLRLIGPRQRSSLANSNDYSSRTIVAWSSILRESRDDRLGRTGCKLVQAPLGLSFLPAIALWGQSIALWGQSKLGPERDCLGTAP